MMSAIVVFGVKQVQGLDSRYGQLKGLRERVPEATRLVPRRHGDCPAILTSGRARSMVLRHAVSSTAATTSCASSALKVH